MECKTASVITTITTANTITNVVNDVYSFARFCPLGNNQGYLLIRGVDRGGGRR